MKGETNEWSIAGSPTNVEAVRRQTICSLSFGFVELYMMCTDFLAGASSGLLLHITYDTQICTYTIIYILIRVILEWLYTYTCEFTFTQSFLRLCWNWPRTSWRNWSYEHLFTSLNNRQPQTVLYWEGIRTYRCPRTAPHPILGHRTWSSGMLWENDENSNDCQLQW